MLIFLIIALVTVVGLFAALIIQSKRVKDLQEAARPKYGFLGKPLMAMVLLAGMFGAILVTYNAVFAPTDSPIVNADKNLTIEIQTQVIVNIDREVIVEFSALPSVEGVLWGEQGDKFDIYWKINGPISSTQIELERSREIPSKFRRTLVKGEYLVEVEIFYGGRRFVKEQRFEF